MSEMQERPSKKQRELLEYVEKFVSEHGYGPSYREIMNGCGYTSVATVAVHINNLIKKGLLKKKDKSARSLEVVNSQNTSPEAKSEGQISESKEKMLLNMIEAKFAQAEASSQAQARVDELRVLIDALKILGFADDASSFEVRLSKIK